MDGWITLDLTPFFNNISVISGRCENDNERLSGNESHFMTEKCSASSGIL